MLKENLLQKVRLQPLRWFESIFPIAKWSRSYSSREALGDLIAGVTVALTLVPQSIAYASLAGLEPQYGLYSCIAGGFVYAIMGTVPQISVGPTALLSLLTATYTSGAGPELAAVLCCLSGIVQLVIGVLQLGFLVEFVSTPVVSGFTSAAAITIASSQIKGLLGLRFRAESFVETWRQLVQHVSESRLADAGLSAGCILLLVGMKALKDIRISEPANEEGRRRAAVLRKSLWTLGVARNAVVVVLASVLAYFLHSGDNQPFILTGNITPGLPSARLPHVWGAEAARLGVGLLVVPLVGLISNIAIAKAFAGGNRLRATQEIVALGACNVAGACAGSMPAGGSFTRGAVAHASAVATPAAGLYTGTIILLTLGLLTPFFYYIPRATLSSVIICAVLHMVDYDIVKKLWRSSRQDLIPLIGTFALALGLGVEIGLICGVALDVVLVMYYNSKPNLDIKIIHNDNLPRHYALRASGGLHFASTERLRSKVLSLREIDNKVLLKHHNNLHDVAVGHNIGLGPKEVTNDDVPPKTLVLYCDGLYRIDYTCLQGLKMLHDEWCRSGRVVCYDLRDDVKDQILAAIPNIVFCNNIEQLRNVLKGSSDETIPVDSGDTQL